ncbi:quinone oxidoreductase [Lysobacter sp. TY2-98]|uniref:quinone oxidoreductase family protein n=1 Tax=Lysobacter sp. TY2-98 TaxID=2290922 RepID=UPI000E2073AD|nr:quinone oxidoreductase [Lysobacter sp. TY2-98]AXK72500.1 quinone oxidoreductase [Lysobacter sp. TY2-98]
MKALTFDRFGGPDVLVYRDVADATPGAGQALVRLRAIGLNFADIYRRQGHYHLAGDPPWIAGYEGSGEIVSAPEGSGFAVGDRVAFADAPFANAELAAVDVDRLIPLPDDIEHDVAAALLLQGLTAQYLVRDSFALRSGHVALVHAAAGGVGQLLVQLAKAAGARVIALASTAAKCEVARRAGADEATTYEGDWVARVQEFAPGGIDVAYDSVGRTLHDSLCALRTGGAVVFYGMAGGDPDPVDPRVLMDGSKTITGGDLWNVLRTAEDRRTRAAELFDAVRRGDLNVAIDARFPLADGAAAHALLESRRALGKVLLIP